MRALKLAFSEFFIEQKNNVLLSVTIYLTVVICFFSIFTSMRVLQKNAVSFKSAAEALAFNEIQINPNKLTSCKAFTDALDTLEDKYNADISGTAFNSMESQLEYYIDNFGELIAAVDIVDDNSFPYGENSIIFDDEVLYNGKKISVGDKITLLGVELTVSEIGKQNAVSRSTFSKMEWSSPTDVSLSINSISFPHQLTETETAEISDLLVPMQPLVSQGELADQTNAKVKSDQILICALISVLSVLITITLFKQLMRELISKIAAFKLYGCKTGFVIGIFFLSLSLYIVISFVLAAVIFHLCNGLFVRLNLSEQISFSLELLPLIVIFVLSLLFTLPSALKIANSTPARLEIRR